MNTDDILVKAGIYADLTNTEKGILFTLLSLTRLLGYIPNPKEMERFGNINLQKLLQVEQKLKVHNVSISDLVKKEVKIKEHQDKKRAIWREQKKKSRLKSSPIVDRSAKRPPKCPIGKEVKKDSMDTPSLRKHNNLVKEHFSMLWDKYPKKIGKHHAIRHYNANIITKGDQLAIEQALDNYLAYLKKRETPYGMVKHGSSFFNQWRDWLDYSDIPDYITPSKED